MTAAVHRPGRSGQAPPPGPPEGRSEAVRDLRDLRASLRELLRTLLRSAVRIALRKVERLAASFDELSQVKSSRLSGVLEGLRAGAEGRNPLWGAVVGAVGAMGTGTRVALVAALLLAVLLLPVTVLLVLLALIVAVVVVAVKS